MDAILDTIDQALREKGLSDSAASKLAVGHPSLIKNLRMPRDGEKRYNLPALMKLAEVLDLEFYFGPRRPAGRQDNVVSLRNLSPDEDAPSGFLIIPWLDAGLNRASAPVAFSRAWLATHGLVPDFLLVAQPDEIAVEDRPPVDSLVLLDTRPVIRKGHGLWCYRTSGRVSVSWVTFAGSVTVIQSSDPEREPQIIDGPPGGAISILGKVVWIGQSLPVKGGIR